MNYTNYLKNEKTFFSIIIATYNADKTLERCLNSLKNQTIEDMEVIVIDGGSNDQTLKIIENYKDIISYTISETDRGISDAWNKGLHVSKGEWIIFLGGDDYLVNDYVLENIKKYKYSYEEIDFMLGNIYLVTDEGERVKKISNEYLENQFKRSMSIPHQGIIHSRKYFEDYGFFDISFKLCADYELLLRKKAPLSVKRIDIEISNMQIGGVSQVYERKVWDEWKKAQLLHNANSKIYINALNLYRKINYHRNKIMRNKL